MKNPFKFFSRFSKNQGQPSERLVFQASTERKLPTYTQWRYFKLLLNKGERYLFFLALFLVVLCVLVFTLRRLNEATAVVPAYGGTYTEGVVGAPQYLNLILSSLSDVDADISALVFPGIFKRNNNLELEPNLITNYVLSEDKLTYTFFLRSNIKWQDNNENLTSDDVVFTIKAIQDVTYQSPLQSTLAGAEVKKIDDFSFSITLKEQFAPFLASLTFGILPEHLWYNVPGQNVRLNGMNLQPVGYGAYKFSELTKDDAGNVKTFTLERNADYFGDKPFIDKMKFVFYPDMTSAILGLTQKRIEGLGFVPQSKKEEITKANKNIIFHSLRIPQYSALFFNLKNNKALQNDVVRQALARAVDRDKIVTEALGGEAEAIYTPILPGYMGYNDQVKKYPLDMEKARKILKDDGWKYPDDKEDQTGVSAEDFAPREKDGVKLEFTIATVDLPEYQAVAQQLIDSWRKIGAKVNLSVTGAQDIQGSVIKERNYEALLFGQIIGSDPDPYPFWHSSQQEYPGLALSIFRNTEIDDIIEEARKTNDEKKRSELYNKFQDLLAQDISAIFLYNPLYTYAVSNRIKGLEENQYVAVPADRFSNIDSWYIKTRRQWK